MMDHLNNYKGKKLYKRKMNDELIEQIRASQYDDDENDEEDLEMVMSRQNRASDIEVAPPPSFARRSHSVHEASTGRKWIGTSSPKAQLLDIDVDLHRTKGNKQSKISSRFLKEAKKKLGKAVRQFVLFTPVPTNVVNSKLLEPMLDTAKEVGKGIKLHSSYDVSI
ncbi:hypothetical protein CsSME_00009186 [Camellia sinensis var. sinensis]